MATTMDGIAYFGDDDNDDSDLASTSTNPSDALTTPPLGQPVLREWELTSDSSRYEKTLAAPSDHELVTMWMLWSVVTFMVSCVIFIVFGSIATSRHAKRNPINVYLLFLMFPDLMLGVCCGINCTFNVILGHYASEHWCYVQSFYNVFAICSNTWMNALIAYQLHSMVKRSLTYSRRRYTAPTTQRVTVQCTLVYFYAAMLATMGIINQNKDFWLYKTGSFNGQGCLPLGYDLPSNLFMYLVFLPLLALIPLIYCGYVCQDVWRHKLLVFPSGGRASGGGGASFAVREEKRRLLSMYIFRILVAFLLMWIPALTLLWVFGHRPWAFWIGGTWAHLQGGVSAVMSMLKPDVQSAVRDFSIGRKPIGRYFLTCFLGVWCCVSTRQSDSQVLDNTAATPGLVIHDDIDDSNEDHSGSCRHWTGFGYLDDKDDDDIDDGDSDNLATEMRSSFQGPEDFDDTHHERQNKHGEDGDGQHNAEDNDKNNDKATTQGIETLPSTLSHETSDQLPIASSNSGLDVESDLDFVETGRRSFVATAPSVVS